MPERILSRTRSPRTWELLNGRWMAAGWKYLYSSSVWLHIVALIPIRQYLSWFDFLRLDWNIESENLPEEVMNLWVFTIWLTSSGCRPHTSSIWPWSGAPKVHLYNTFLGSLAQELWWGNIWYPSGLLPLRSTSPDLTDRPYGSYKKEIRQLCL